MNLFRKTAKPDEEGLAAENDDLATLKAGIEKARLPGPIAEAASREMERLQKTDSSTPEYTIGMNYIEYLLALPWHRCTEDNFDLHRAETILASRHYGLGNVKERILEYLAVRTLCSLRDFHVLVVDDEPIARANVEYVLKKEGYRVDTAGNGLEALGKVRERDFDLILTDLKMEKMDGIQLLEKVKEIAPHTEIVMITGFATVNSAVNALKKGAAHYLPKPIDLEELRSTVRQIRERKRCKQTVRSTVLCFSGPPGTGKTSIGQSIAEALERKFVRISVAGVRDEAELRGHRRTYVGAMPGRILNEIKRLGVRNPVCVLDELDKIGQDFRGDPASVLLEILDPEQNDRFTDHYLDLPFDLSGVMFIATANVVERLPGPLLDRLEVIPFHGYTEKEKGRIARNYLIPKQLREHGLAGKKVEFTDEALTKVVRDYTLEAGLRNLDREIAGVCRKLARICLQTGNTDDDLNVDGPLVEKLLGPPRFFHESAREERQAGVATGLVWSEFGGEIISVEAGIMEGNRQLILTGSLGAVLQESAQTALSYIRSHIDELGVSKDFFRSSDIHIHLPAGAVPKDGPSAGLTILMALVSLLTGRPARRDVALTGELTLSGRVLPVGGIREKILAAQRAGISTVVFPERNRTDVESLDAELTEGVKVVLAREVMPLLNIVLE